MEDDAELLGRWNRGDQAAGGALFDRHFEAVHRFFAHKADGDAADLVQRTFLACLEAAPRFRAEASFRTFLFSIARHELFHHYRRRRRHPQRDVADSSVAELAPSPSTLLRERTARSRLIDALRALPVDLQLLLELHYWEELSGPELAAVLEIPEGTVRSRLRRARELLRERLAIDDAAPLSAGDVMRANREPRSPGAGSASTPR